MTPNKYHNFATIKSKNTALSAALSSAAPACRPCPSPSCSPYKKKKFENNKPTYTM